ncbi:MAG TPA: MFS transporter [Anaerolineales bacterium]|nr:MFS transporter [Anaerolineales bacterium]
MSSPSSERLARPLQAVVARLFGYLPPDVRHNQFADLFAALAFGPLVASLGFIPVVLRNLGASPEWLAVYSAQPFLGFVVAPWLALLFPPRFGLKRMALVAWAISRGSFLLIGLVGDWPALMAVTALFWVIEAVPAPAYVRIMQAVFPVKLRGRVMANVRIALSLVTLVATAAAGWLLDTIGYRVLFPLVSIGGIASVILFSRLKFDESNLPPSRASGGAITRILRRDSRFVLFLSAVVAFGVGFLSIGPLLPLVQVDQLKLSYTEIGALTTVNSVFFVIGYVVLGRWIDRAGGVQVLRWIFVIGGIVPVCYAFADSVWVLIPAFAAMGFMNAGLDLGMLNSVIQLCDPDELGAYSSLQYTVVGLRGLIAPFLGVWAVRAGLPMSWAFVAGAVLIGLAVVILARVRALPPQKESPAEFAPAPEG